MIMAKHGRTKLVPLEIKSKEQVLETVEQVSPEQEEALKSELDLETVCPRCHELMELHSSFDKLMYSCDSCCFLLKCV
jgi:hypothetical protein